MNDLWEIVVYPDYASVANVTLHPVRGEFNLIRKELFFSFRQRMAQQNPAYISKFRIDQNFNFQF